MTDSEAAEYWAEKYEGSDPIWSGEPNRGLVSTVADLRPGRALDLGCGEGGDSVWLADRGWQVTAVDIVATAVSRGRALAAARGVPDGRITWVVEDLSSWRPTDNYDLVSACFLHSPVDFPRAEVLQRAASALVPGGHLLLVGHATFPRWAENAHHGDHGDHRLLTPAEEISALQLPPDDWSVVLAEVRTRPAKGPNGEVATLEDAVVFIRRR